MQTKRELSKGDKDRIIQMAWEDRTTFEAIKQQFGLPEKEVIKLMRKEMKESSFKMWRKRVQGRKSKHQAYAVDPGKRFKSTRQKAISGNKIT